MSSQTILQYRGKRVKVHHGYLNAKDCPWPKGHVFTCRRCKRVSCYCFGNDSPRCDECDNLVIEAAERKAARRD